ncbi:probable maltase-glucoamylase 2 [Fundulus heteroclitus]|uniref:probable maltase-glucoamylase 2 n=1 Tax=Fundulus heteroclitus TaxID=8078 RepID=UPI00165B1B90|nr:probable maltase-glucoamylase 2 [Fundulus heteroclitus]
MLPSVLLLLLLCTSLCSGAQAGYYGVVYTYSFLDHQQFGYQLTNTFKLSFSSCEELDTLICNGSCFGSPVYAIDESRGEWCQKDYILTTNIDFLSTLYSVFGFANWTANINGIELSAAVAQIELRNRSDINKPNSSPRTTILPLVRVPSNCQRNINLLVSDPDGDEVRCRYAAGVECHTCTPPSVLTVSPACTLSFSPTNSSAEGPYAVQLMIEDFPRQTINVTNGNNSQEVITTSDSLSKIPVQFVFRVDPAAPSCTEGVYLPRFLPPTPENGAQIYTDVNQTVQISVRAEATQAVITELLFSGPHSVAKSSSGSGNFTLTWTPSASDAELTNTFCFVVQANFSSSVYQSDLRCILVTTGSSPTTPTPLTTAANLTTTPRFTPSFTTTPPTTTTTTSTIPNSTVDPGPYYVLALNAKISTTLSLTNYTDTIIRLIKDELMRQGLPSDIILELLRSAELGVTTIG